MLVPLMLITALAFTRSYAGCAENLAQKKATLEAQVATEKEEVLRWTELSESAQTKFSAAKRQLVALRADLRIDQDELMAASNRVHCAQNKQAELDQLACQLKNKLDEEYQRKIALERNISMRLRRKRKRNTRQAPYPWSDPPAQSQSQSQSQSHAVISRAAIAPSRKVEGRSAAKSSQGQSKPAVRELGADLDLSKLSDIELLRKSLDPIYRQTIDSLARQNSAETRLKEGDGRSKEVAAKARDVGGVAPSSGVQSGASNAAAPRNDVTSSPTHGGCDQHEADDAATLRKVKLDIFQDEALLRNAEEQLDSARTLLSAEQTRLDEISRSICAARYELKDAERAARDKLDALQQTQCQTAAHQDQLSQASKQLQSVVAEMTRREMDQLMSRNENNANTEQHPVERKA